MADTKTAHPAPFFLSLGLLAVVLFAMMQGGWWLALIPFSSWILFSILDSLIGTNPVNPDPETPDADLFWHKLVVIGWFPLQFLVIFGAIFYVTQTDAMDKSEAFWLFFGIGVLTGTIGIVYAHELMHQKNRLERWMADLLLASVLYSHFRSEHLLVHHRYVGTPRDAVTARYNESFYRFFPRVLSESLTSSWTAEADLQARKNKSSFNLQNPFARYFALQTGMLILAFVIGGWVGVALFCWQAFVAIWQLELVNYLEHYGLTRKHLGNGKYEHVQPRHSWNSDQRASNWLLINLQRHSDHHYKPDRRYPLLQTYGSSDAPQLPYGYPLMTMLAMVPPVFRKIMNPRVRKWHAMYYPEITDWGPYKTASNPMPR